MWVGYKAFIFPELVDAYMRAKQNGSLKKLPLTNQYGYNLALCVITFRSGASFKVRIVVIIPKKGFDEYRFIPRPPTFQVFFH